jgi:hypothetical protein
MPESMLIVVTAAAVGLALAMGMIVFVLLRHERSRSNARAAMLAEMAADTTEPSAPADIELADDFASELTIEPAAGSDLFAAPPARSAWPSRIAIAGALIAVLFVAGSVLRGRIATHSPQQNPIAAEPTSGPVQLDLLSLRHSQQPGSLTITGLVQNPRTGTPLSKITATAMLFGENDTFVASGRTPLDITTLRPGDESGFVITIALDPSTSTTVTRYRVGFRGDDGRIIGHVDRRSTSPIARGPS